jgi:hypothetical protein
MPECCPKCGLSYFPEPGFYYGAMFMSYIITAFFSLGVVGFCIIVLEMSVGQSFALLIFLHVILFVWFFRTSRSVWLHIATH